MRPRILTRFPLLFLSLLVFVLLVSARASWADVPSSFTYQGVVQDASGNPLSDGTHSFRFRLFPLANAFNPIWEETLSLNTVNGLFNATLGETVPFVQSPWNAPFDTKYWLGVALDGGEDIIRVPLNSSPYALRAGALDDGTVTGSKIVNGNVVRSLNGLHDDLVLQGANGVSVSSTGNTITVLGSGGGGGGDSDWAISGNNMYAIPSGFVGIGTATPTRNLEVVGGGINGTQLEIRDESSAQSWSEALLRLKAYGGYSGYFSMVSTTSGSNTFGMYASGLGTKIVIKSSDKLSMYYDTTLELGTQGNDIKATLDDQGLLSLYNPSDVSTVEVNPDYASGGGLISLSNASATSTVQLSGAHAYGSDLTLRNVDGANVFEVIGGTSSSNRDAIVSMHDPAGHQTVVMRSNSDSGAEQGGGYFALRSENSVTTFKLEAQEDAVATQGSAMKFYNDSGVQTVEIDADYGSSNQGRISTDVLEITGGSDLSENFDVSANGAHLRPGTVVSIDPTHPGKLAVSRHGYDRTVAGVVSGAGGVRTGMLMGQKGSEADGRLPIALSGRVYVWCDAAAGPIEPGDLLTSSDTAGHAQRVGDFSKAHGAILGKAMSHLESGRGLVLVLISLQ